MTLRLFVVSHILLIVAFSVLAIVAADELTGNASISHGAKHSSRLIINPTIPLQLCIDNYPDGVFVLYTFDGVEVIVILKHDRYWAKPAKLLQKALMGNDSSALLAEMDETYLVPEDTWPISPDTAVSTTGFPTDSLFFNNVFVFKHQNLFRYRVDPSDPNDKQSYNLEVRFISSHSVTYWMWFPSYRDIISIITPQRTRGFLIINKLKPLKSASLYIFNQNNLDSPVHHNADASELIVGDDVPASYIKFYYKISSNETLVLTNDGKFCIKGRCQAFYDERSCSTKTRAFISSFSYWLWKRTELNLRLLMISLASISIINLATSLSFIFNQIKRVADLT